jgi:lysophospholipase L1-like esterase
MLAKLGVSVGVANGLTLTRNADMTYTLSLGTTQGELPIGNSVAKGSYDNTSYLWGVTDSVGRRMLTVYTDGTVEGKFTSPELITARGTRATLNDRMSAFLSDYGAPKQYIINEHRLRRFRYLRRKRLLAESSQIVIAMIGDSYTHDPDRYSGPVASTLISELGDAGGGWVGFASLSGDINGNVRPASYVLSRIGTWGEGTSSNYYTIPGPDLGQAASSTVGDRQTVTGPASPTLSAARFFWNGTGTGVMRYRWNGGAWTNINVQGAGVQSALLGGLPASGAWTLDMEVVSGTCQPCGVDFQSAASGVRVHKLGCTGSRTNQWTAVDAAQWQASITSLAPQLVTIMLGTNDQTIARTPAEVAADLTTIITRVKAAMPSVDIAIMMPAENQRGLATLMSTYAAAAVEVAYTQNCAYLDTQYLFGDASNPTEYGSAGTIPLYSADLVHPLASTGGRVIADGVMRFFTTV